MKRVRGPVDEGVYTGCGERTRCEIESIKI